MENENLSQAFEREVKKNTESGRLDGQNPTPLRPKKASAQDDSTKKNGHREHPDKKQTLDDDIKDTFPASDPITHY